MRIGVALAWRPFGRDRTGAQAQALVAAFRRAGHEAETIPVPLSEGPGARIAEQMLACFLLDLEESMGTRIDRLISLNFPAYHIPHTARTVWLLGRHRAAGVPADAEEAADAPLDRLIRDADRRRLPAARAVFAANEALAAWLGEACAITAPVLRAPPARPELWAGQGKGQGKGVGKDPGATADVGEDYVLLPEAGRGAEGSDGRAALALEALRLCRTPVRLVMAGTPDAPLRAAAAAFGERVAWRASGDLPAAMGGCLAVMLPAFGDEDGAAALEAMLAGKPVVTCADSGAVAELVDDGATGLVRAADAALLAEALDALWDDRRVTRRLGQAARARYDALNLSWEAVAGRLLDS